MEAAWASLAEKGPGKIDPYFMPKILPNMAAGQVSLQFGLKGYNSTVTTACAASTQAIGEAMEVIRRGDADVMLTGGTEAGISLVGLAGFSILRALSTAHADQPALASRPFDLDRDGFVPAEGAGIFVIESLEHARARDARILCELAGYGATADAFHIVAPAEDGEGAARAMRMAIADAGMEPDEIDYVNAHGTSTPLNDVSETRAIKRVFGEAAYQVPVSSTKSLVGHALGGAGAVEMIACVKTITSGIIHPTINLETPDPDCDLDYVPNVAREADVNAVLKNSFGFGGQNACLVLKKFEE
jgi:3-oxoacyl-[acyl-carrier-protein] synthase II